MPEDGTAADEALAEAAGLRLAWERHRADVEEAIRGMAALRASFSRPAEPAPPYAMPSDAAVRRQGAEG